MKSEELKGKRLAVFGANNVVDEVTAYARKHGIVLVSVGNVPEAPMHQVSDEQYYMDCTDEAAMLRFFKEKHIDGLLSCSGEMGINLQFLRRNEDIRYNQFNREFVPDLSIIDLMMYCSRDEIHDMLDRYHFL